MFARAKFEATLYVELVLQGFDEVCRHLIQDQEGSGKGIYAMMEPDIKAEFQRLSLDCKHILRWTEALFNYYGGLRVAREVRP